MADEKEFAKELNALIKRYIDGGCDPEDIADQITCSPITTSKFI